MQKWVLVTILCLNSFVSAQNIQISKMYETVDKGKERLYFVYYVNKTTGIYNYTFYGFNDQDFNRIYCNKNNQVIAEVNHFDSVYYKYYKDDSAVIYNTYEGKPYRDSKLIFNKTGKVILKMGYLHKTTEVVSYTRNTYLNDTLLIGSADFYIKSLYDIVDTSLTDSTFYTYDKKGRLTGEYMMKKHHSNEIDSNFIYEYDHTDTSKTFWGYEQVNGKFVVYKRYVSFNDGKGNELKRIYYDFPDKYDGCTEYFYEEMKDKTKVSKTTLHRRADGSIWKTQTYRHEIIER